MQWRKVAEDACELARRDRAGRLVNELVAETYLHPGDIGKLDRIWERLLGWEFLFCGGVKEAAGFLGLRTEF